MLGAGRHDPGIAGLEKQALPFDLELCATFDEIANRFILMTSDGRRHADFFIVPNTLADFSARFEPCAQLCDYPRGNETRRLFGYLNALDARHDDFPLNDIGLRWMGNALLNAQVPSELLIIDDRSGVGALVARVCGNRRSLVLGSWCAALAVLVARPGESRRRESQQARHVITAGDKIACAGCRKNWPLLAFGSTFSIAQHAAAISDTS